MIVMKLKDFLRRAAAVLSAAMLIHAPLPTAAADADAPFTDTVPAGFTATVSDRLAVIPESILSLIPSEALASWQLYHRALRTGIPTKLQDTENLYSAIHVFSLPAEDVRAALADSWTEEEIALLLSDDEAAVLALFSAPGAIAVGDAVYSPEWIYSHTIEEYAFNGVSPAEIAAHLPYYAFDGYTQTAADSFSKKLYDYTGTVFAVKPDQWLLGDVDGNGHLTVRDVRLLQRYLHGSAQFQFLDFARADLDKSGTVDVLDLGMLKRLSDTFEEDVPSVMLPVMEFSQHPDYPTGCESAALYMLLRYYGTNVTMAQIVSVLPKGPAPYESGGVLYGANPEREFVGDPRSSSSYGVFEKPIAQTAATFRPGVKCQTGATMDQIVTLLQQGSPVVAWYTTNPTTGITYRREWIDYQTGETVRWPSGEHAVVICGTDGDMLTYRDPNTGGSVTMLKSEFLKVFNVLGARIVYYPN